MIKVITKEYSEGDLAVQDTIITFFNVPIYKHKKTTTNRQVVAILTNTKQQTKIKGFNHETKNKNKKN